MSTRIQGILERLGQVIGGDTDQDRLQRMADNMGILPTAGQLSQEQFDEINLANKPVINPEDTRLQDPIMDAVNLPASMQPVQNVPGQPQVVNAITDKELGEAEQLGIAGQEREIGPIGTQDNVPDYLKPDGAEAMDDLISKSKAQAQVAMKAKDQPGFWESLDREQMIRFAIGFNALRTNSDPELTKALTKELEGLQKGKGSGLQSEYLKKYHPDIYKLVQDGNMSLKDAVSIAKLKQPGGIQVGSIPKDYILKRDDKGNAYLEVIPGSQTAKEQEAMEGKTELKLHSTIDKADMINTNVDKAIEMLETEEWATGIKGAFVRDYGGFLAAGSPAINLESMITHLKANIGFDKLQRMREESPTGGALGQVAVQELVALQATLGSLDLRQDPQLIIDTLNHVRDTYNNNMNIILQQYGADELKKYGIEYGPADKSDGKKQNDPLKIR